MPACHRSARLALSPVVAPRLAAHDSEAAGAFYADCVTRLHLLELPGEEIQRRSPDWVLVRTASRGTVRGLATDMTLTGAGQDLFVLHRQPDDGRWRIARYAAASTRCGAATGLVVSDAMAMRLL